MMNKLFGSAALAMLVAAAPAPAYVKAAASPVPGQLKEFSKVERPYVPPTETGVPQARPAAAVHTGPWRVQFGAFRDRGNAETLWNRIRGRLAGAQPAYVQTAGVTRLQATGYASKAEAERACRDGCRLRDGQGVVSQAVKGLLRVLFKVLKKSGQR